MGDIYIAKYPHFAIVRLGIKPHLCSVENRSVWMGLTAQNEVRTTLLICINLFSFLLGVAPLRSEEVD